MAPQASNNNSNTEFNIVEASIADHRRALDAGTITAVDLLYAYLQRIAVYDTQAGLNAFARINWHCINEAKASDARRAQGLPPRPLEGIPYTLKDNYMYGSTYTSLPITNGSPALDGLMSSGDSAIAQKLRDAGAVLVGITNMPPMAAGGMQRGLYGRPESPYNEKYLPAAFSSGSSSGAAVATAASMAVFGMGSETVSSGRSPASNNGLVCYTPSRGVLSCRGMFPLYVTCDVPVPLTRSVADMQELLNVLATPDADTEGDFWREQNHVELPRLPELDWTSLRNTDALRGKRIGVPKMYVGEKDSDPHAKQPFVYDEVRNLWFKTARELENLGAQIIYTDFPLVTNYENDSVSGEANNVRGAPGGWNATERSTLIAKAWDDFLRRIGDDDFPCLAAIEHPELLFPKPDNYLPDKWLEARNWIDYASLPALAEELKDVSIYAIPGLSQVLPALEEQRKRDLEDWMKQNNLDLIAFPAQGDIGFADVETNFASAKHSLRNGVKHSHGNRALRHLGVPTVSIPMGMLQYKHMPLNITFCGPAYSDALLLGTAYAFEHHTRKRFAPPLTPTLESDVVLPQLPALAPPRFGERLRASAHAHVEGANRYTLQVHGACEYPADEALTLLEVVIDGRARWLDVVREAYWTVEFKFVPRRKGWGGNSRTGGWGREIEEKRVKGFHEDDDDDDDDDDEHDDDKGKGFDDDGTEEKELAGGTDEEKGLAVGTAQDEKSPDGMTSSKHSDDTNTTKPHHTHQKPSQSYPGSTLGTLRWDMQPLKPKKAMLLIFLRTFHRHQMYVESDVCWVALDGG